MPTGGTHQCGGGGLSSAFVGLWADCTSPCHAPTSMQFDTSNLLHEKKDKEYMEKTIVLNSEKESFKNKLNLLQQGAWSSWRSCGVA